MFHHPRIDINVADILIRGGEANKYPIKMIVIEFSPTIPRLADTDARAEYLHVLQVWAVTKPCLIGHDFSYGVHPMVVDTHGMDKGHRPVAGGETRSIKEQKSGDGKCLVPTFCTCILGGAICARGFNHILMMAEDFQLKSGTPGQFLAQVSPDNISLGGTM